MAPRNRKKPPPPIPYAVALFYEPSIAAAFAAGVQLPHSRLTIPIPYDEGVRSGVLLPLSTIHVDPNAPPPDAPPPLITDPPLHKHIHLPATIYASTSAIHPSNFDIADAFVRIQDFDPTTMVIPEPAPGMSTAGVLFGAGVIKPGEALNRLPSVRVRRTSELKAVLKRDGPILVMVEGLEQLREAPEVFELLQEKIEEGWDCKPEIKVFSSLATIAVKTEEVHSSLLPKLRKRLRMRKRGNRVKRRIKVIKKNLREVRRKVQGAVITPGICGNIPRAISRVHAKKPQKRPTYLLRQIDEWSPLLAADLARPVVFVQ